MEGLVVNGLLDTKQSEYSRMRGGSEMKGLSTYVLMAPPPSIFGKGNIYQDVNL